MSSPTASADLAEAQAEIDRLRRENAELRARFTGAAEPTPQALAPSPDLPLLGQPAAPVNNSSPAAAKVALFRSLFRGREDVHAVRWTSERTGKSGYSPACEDPWSLRKGQARKYLALTDSVVHEHLAGAKTIGVFPLLKGDVCWFLACDFDKEGWQLDALAYLEACGRFGVPAYLERSRSGNGGHVWTFFSAPVASVQARQLGMRLLRQTMDARGDMDLGSYDRFFPNQDFVPKGGFGNLIALPLQKQCRAIGNSEFVDPSSHQLKPWPDQWAFLDGVRRLGQDEVGAILETLPALAAGPSQAVPVTPATRARHPAPKQIRCESGASFSVEKSGIPPWLMSRIKHLAALHNPQFYRNEKLRLSTHLIPRFIRCYREDFSHVHLPRGLREDVAALAREAGSELLCTERRPLPEAVSFRFQGALMADQEKAVDAVLAHDMGLLVAPPGAGKTVMGCNAIARRSLPTLVLADRKPILDQWRAQLMGLLGLKSRQIGQVGGGRDRRSGIVDLATIQSLARRDDLGEFFSRYGFIVVDECHHLPAATFEACLREAPTRYILGLTATPYRRDGLDDIIAMQCGPVRHRMAERGSCLPLRLVPKETALRLGAQAEEPRIQEVFRTMVEDEARNALIVDDVCAALGRGRRCLVLSHWKEHCRSLAEALRSRGKSPFILCGGLGKKERAAILKAIADTPHDGDLVIIATGQFLGEGFDCPQLDTLFLAFPVAFRGKLVQYTGRVMREHPGKTGVEAYDYVDAGVPVLRRMFQRRRKAYSGMAFEESEGLLAPVAGLG